MDNIYEQIKQVAGKKGYTLYSLAEKMGITRQALNAAMKSPSYPTLEKIAKALDIEEWELLAPPDRAIVPPQIIAQFYFKGQMFFATTFMEVRGLVDNLENQLMEMERNLHQKND